MKLAAKILAALVAIVVVAGLLVCAIGRVRAAADRLKCKNNLKQIGMTIHNYHECNSRFPAGTVQGTELPPDRRLSWYFEIWPFVESRPHLHVDRAKAWDDPENNPPREHEATEGKRFTGRLVVVGQVTIFQCRPAPHDPDQPSPVHYVGIAGLGADAATLPLTDPRAGFFGYDRKLTDADVKDGLATTLMVLEASDGGPWTAGGRATVRGLANDAPYLGGQFDNNHRRAWPFPKRRSMNALFADGSVRVLDYSTSPQVIEALATVAAGDEAEPLPPLLD